MKSDRRLFQCMAIIFMLAALPFAGCAAEQGAKTLPANPKYRDASLPIPARVEDLLSYMTLEEKIAQMAQAVNYAASADDVKRYGLGSVLCGGSDHPGTGFAARDWLALYNEYQGAAMKSRLGIPVLFGIDSVHGDAKIQGATVFPQNIGLGAANDPALVERIGRITAIEGRAGGLTWNFAPCIAVTRDERWGRAYESFSESPEITSALGAAYVRGLQYGGISARDAMAACIKHYFADGGAEWGTGMNGGIDRGNSTLEEGELRRIHLSPYAAALKENPASVMISFSSVGGVKMHENKKWIDALKNELGFGGLIVSDWAGWKELADPNPFAACINAGIDMVMIPEEYRQFLGDVAQNVKDGVIERKRIDEAVGKILRMKFEMGLFENPMADETLLEKVGSDEHMETAREAVRKSLVLLKNDGKALPIAKGEKIAVVGTKAKDMGVLCGGWTLFWGGYSEYEALHRMLDENSRLAKRLGLSVKGTNILDAFTAKAGASRVLYSGDGASLSGAKKAVVVIGEVPYAEFAGDTNDLSVNIVDVKRIQRIKAQGISVIAVIIGGRPLILDQIEPFCDAIVAAWLPGSMAGPGIADVLYGDFDFSGKLPVTWPKDMAQVPINEGDGKKGLYPLGYGLRYR